MNRILILLYFALFACGNSNQKAATVSAQTPPQETVNPDSNAIITLALQFDSLNTQVRDNKIDRVQAQKELQRIVPALQTAYSCLKSDMAKSKKWVFPVENYTSKAIGGTHGEGYVPNGYDYFLGNKHGGHPAHDIFIYDKNQDSKDDRTGKFVNVLSVGNGIVIALETKWDTTSVLRGGKYIWIYTPAENALYYYAHNNEVLVKIGQIINAGDTIATVGRTGLNAFKKRSPTHLHLMKLTFDKNFYPRPIDTYKEFLKYESNK